LTRECLHVFAESLLETVQAIDLVLGALSSQKVSAAELAEIRQILTEYEKRSR